MNFPSSNSKQDAREIGLALMEHKFRKRKVYNALLDSKSGTGKWLKRDFPEFNPVLEEEASPERRTSILMASFPFRKEWMLKCIEKLIPQCDNFYLWLNEYKEIPEELKKFDQ